MLLDSCVDGRKERFGWGRREWEGGGRKAEGGGLAEAFDVPKAHDSKIRCREANPRGQEASQRLPGPGEPSAKRTSKPGRSEASLRGPCIPPMGHQTIKTNPTLPQVKLLRNPMLGEGKG